MADFSEEGKGKFVQDTTNALIILEVVIGNKREITEMLVIKLPIIFIAH